MENFPKPKVFHGSPTKFDGPEAIPTRQIRAETVEGERVVTFDEESFHATPHKWIALAYTYSAKEIADHEKKVSYDMGVNLHENEHRVRVWGVGSLEETLNQMYGDGGYLYHFDRGEFIYKEGLGSMEVITNDPVTPLESEYIPDPVQEMRDLGVEFSFIDVTKED